MRLSADTALAPARFSGRRPSPLKTLFYTVLTATVLGGASASQAAPVPVWAKKAPEVQKPVEPSPENLEKQAKEKAELEAKQQVIRDQEEAVKKQAKEEHRRFTRLRMLEQAVLDRGQTQGDKAVELAQHLADEGRRININSNAQGHLDALANSLAAGKETYDAADVRKHITWIWQDDPLSKKKADAIVVYIRDVGEKGRTALESLKTSTLFTDNERKALFDSKKTKNLFVSALDSHLILSLLGSNMGGEMWTYQRDQKRPYPTFLAGHDYENAKTLPWATAK
jgi:hypothetical protein